jgi:nuclear pore complex protein Nup107
MQVPLVIMPSSDTHFFLVSLELGADPGERRLALTRAREHGLDMDCVAMVTAERTIERAFEVS